MNVGELKKALKDLPDNAEVLLSVNCVTEFGTVDRPYRSRGEHHVMKHVVWGNKYQTREVHNAYGCNDDRYGGRALCVEVGELSD